MTPLLRFENASFRYSGRQVLENISFSVRSGTCTALIGANGVGKTTLLRLGSGALTATSGAVLVNGKKINGLSHRNRSRLVALVPQELDVPFDFTVEQIVAQGRTPYLGMLRGLLPEDRAAVERALEWTDTATLRKRIFNELSGGERQRVKIALGLAQDPQLLLLDEPTQNLDIGRQVELMELLRRLRGEGLAVLASIHDLHLIRWNFSEVHLLGPGTSFVSGPPDAILTTENLQKAFNYVSRRHQLPFHPSDLVETL
ncbi:ABC transporter ATP-binding protein [Terriglobus albidus]|uniref:ABC transporter ATP-binding protein n=1 Tax=Terriglobus albidus TaxID=1592106 RepID=UPI0021E0F599|nr:ABC transporter ATP-binding protein [Terriglobus albidus]